MRWSFIARPAYTKDIELSLSFVDAIWNFGVFTPIGMRHNYVYVPVHQENVQNEGCSSQVWSSFHYGDYLLYLKALGVLVKYVDTHQKWISMVDLKV